MALKPIELVHREIMAAGPENPHYHLAANFEKSCAQLWSAEVGQNLIRYLAAHAHPCKHIPYSDPYEAAAAHGRAEVVAFIVMMASPDDIPMLSTLTNEYLNYGNPNTAKENRRPHESWPRLEVTTGPVPAGGPP